ncbi:peptide-methionine (R)-S-oxide reductase MsrB [Salinimicrobium soli]|uniref:peptide-methionine (R)-S-oxide reductase MsrB n=1 Tax=Salinimicrobium soli TaxID=1254399 RepID=UPI003AABDBD1
MKKLKLFLVPIAAVVLIACGGQEKEKEQENIMTQVEGVEVQTQAQDPINADTIDVGTVNKTEEEWREILSPEAYHILREAGTERAFQNAYYDNEEEGIYYCGACGLPLYSSNTKFHSGTGWPSFYAPIDPKLVKRKLDTRFDMERTEVVCAQCGSHLGHIFPYEGVPTGERHCLNSLALDFKPKDL